MFDEDFAYNFFFLNKEVLFLYNRMEPISQTTKMKIAPMILFTLQLAECCCYIIIHRYITSHYNQMLENSIISMDVYQKRKQIHLFSVAEQLHGFLVEMVYLGVILLHRILGKHIASSNRYSLSNPVCFSTFLILRNPFSQKGFTVRFNR